MLAVWEYSAGRQDDNALSCQTTYEVVAMCLRMPLNPTRTASEHTFAIALLHDDIDLLSGSTQAVLDCSSYLVVSTPYHIPIAMPLHFVSSGSLLKTGSGM